MQLNVLSFVIFKDCAINIQWCNVQWLNGALCCPQKKLKKNPPPCYTVHHIYENIKIMDVIIRVMGLVDIVKKDFVDKKFQDSKLFEQIVYIQQRLICWIFLQI